MNAPGGKSKNQIDTIDITPPPEGMVSMCLELFVHGETPKARKEGREVLDRAMRIAYAYWYGRTKPEYHIKNIGDSEPLAKSTGKI